MGLNKTEVNLRRLLVAAPNQQNQAKLMHYVTTLREQLEELSNEKNSDGFPRVSKALLNEYSEKIEAIATKAAVSAPSTEDAEEPANETRASESHFVTEGEIAWSSGGLRRRILLTSSEHPTSQAVPGSSSEKLVKLDADAETHIERHRNLQEDLTDDMVDLARQLKENSLAMSQSIRNEEKILDSTEKAMEQSLASTGHAVARATEIYSQSSATSCFTWVLIFAMMCIFIMVVLLIRVT